MNSMRRTDSIGTCQGNKFCNDGLFYYVCMNGRNLVVKEGYINFDNKKINNTTMEGLNDEKCNKTN